MSQFGDGTFKQDLLEALEAVISDHNLPTYQAIGDIANVLSYLANTAFSKDMALRVIKEDAIARAKEELTAQLRGLTVKELPELPKPKLPKPELTAFKGAPKPRTSRRGGPR